MSPTRGAEFITFYDDKIREMQGINYGGTLRTLKGRLVETLCENMVRESWISLGGQIRRLTVDKRKYQFTDAHRHSYGLSQDKQVYIDGKFVISFECKAYAEVAMYKRIMVDSHILQSRFPDLVFCLFQLESMLGGDYSTDPSHPLGSPPVHVVNTFFPKVKLEVITLLDGGRKVKEPIHQPAYYKPMTLPRVLYALNYLEGVLKQYI